MVKKQKIIVLGIHHDMEKKKLVHQDAVKVIFDKYAVELISKKTLIISEDVLSLSKEIHFCKCGECQVKPEHKLGVIKEIFDAELSVLKTIQADVVIADKRKLSGTKSESYMNLCRNMIVNKYFLINNPKKFSEVFKKTKRIQEGLRRLENSGDLIINRDGMKELYDKDLIVSFKDMTYFLTNDIVSSCETDLVHSLNFHLENTCTVHQYDTFIIIAGLAHLDGIQKKNLIHQDLNPEFQNCSNFEIRNGIIYGSKKDNNKIIDSLSPELFSLAILVYPNEDLFNYIFK